MHRIKKLSLTCATVSIAAIALSGCGAEGPTAEPTPGSTVVVDAPTAALAQASFEDNVLATEDVTITITDVKTIQVGEDGNEYGDKPVIAFWYDTTNVSGKEADPGTAWIYRFEAYQDNDPNAENKLAVGSLPDAAFLDSQMNKIKEGGTVPNAIAYELSDTTTPVKLVATANLGQDEIGSMTFELQQVETTAEPVFESDPVAQKFTTALDSLGIEYTPPVRAEVGLSGARMRFDMAVNGYDAGINVFGDGEALAVWQEASDSFGGVHVALPDAYAVLTLNSSEGIADSARIAPMIAEAVGGTAHGA